MPTIVWRDIAQVAYNTYGEHQNWRNYLDKPMPKWEDLPEDIKLAWEAAVLEAYMEANSILSEESAT